MYDAVTEELLEELEGPGTLVKCIAYFEAGGAQAGGAGGGGGDDAPSSLIAAGYGCGRRHGEDDDKWRNAAGWKVGTIRVWDAGEALGAVGLGAAQLLLSLPPSHALSACSERPSRRPPPCCFVRHLRAEGGEVIRRRD